MATTTHFGWTYMSEYEDPWYVSFKAFVDAVDDKCYALSPGTIIDVRNYGALADEVTDSTTYINNAIAALVSGSTLAFYPGTGSYIISGTLTALPDDVSVICYGGVAIKQKAASGSIVFFTPGNNNKFIVNIDGNETSPWTMQSFGIYSNIASPKSNVTVTNSNFKNILTPIRGDGIQKWRAYGNYFYHTGSSAILCGANATNPVKYNIFGKNNFGWCGDYAIAFYPQANNSEISYNKVIGNIAKDTQVITSGYAFGVEGGNAYGYLHHNDFIGNTVEQTDTYVTYGMGGVILGAYSEHSKVSDNTLKGNFLNHASGISAATTRYCTINDNKLYNFSGHTISIERSTNCDVIDNKLVDCGSLTNYAAICIALTGDTTINANIDGNTIINTSGFTGSSISIYAYNNASTANLTISNNKIYGFIGYGICIAGSAGKLIKNVNISENKFFTSATTFPPIYTDYILGGSIEGNKIADCSRGINFVHSTYLDIGGNRISDKRGAPALTYYVLEGTGSDYNYVHDNIFSDTISDTITIVGANSRVFNYFGGNIGIGFTAPLSPLCVPSAHVGGESAAGDNNLLVDGDIGATGARVPKGWFTNLEITNLPTINGVGISGELLIGSANLGMNVTTDQSITITLPPGYTKYNISNITVYSPSLSMTTAAGGIYTAASKGGVAVVAAAQVYTTLTNDTPNTAGNRMTLTNAIANSYFTATPLYFSLTTAQGAAATAKIAIFGYPLP